MQILKNNAMKQNYLKQVMVLNEQSHQEYLEAFTEEPLNFWDYVNTMLGTLYDNEHNIEKIIPNHDGSSVVVIYLIQIVRKSQK